LDTARFASRWVEARNGAAVLLRPAQPEDAPQMVANLELVASEGIYLATERAPWTPEELAELLS